MLSSLEVVPHAATGALTLLQGTFGVALPPTVMLLMDVSAAKNTTGQMPLSWRLNHKALGGVFAR